MKALKDSHFTNRNYPLLYGHNMLKAGAYLTMFLFVSGWLFESGLPLYAIILYHMAHFAIMGLVSPLGSHLCHHIGIAKTYGLSFFLYCSSLSLLSFADGQIGLIALAVLVSGISQGIHNPADNMQAAIFFKNHNRGRAVSLSIVLNALATMLSVLIAGMLMAEYGFWSVTAMSALLMFASYICIANMDDDRKIVAPPRAIEAYRELFSKEFGPILQIGLGFQFVIIGSIVFVPIMLYLATEDFSDMAWIAALAILAQSVAILISGHFVDKSAANHPLRFALSINFIALVFYGFFASGKLSLFIADSLQRTGFFLFLGALMPRLQSHGINQKKDLVPYGASIHMAVCFWEFWVLGALAIVVAIYGEAALPYCLLLCGLGGFFAYFGLRSLNSRAAEGA